MTLHNYVRLPGDGFYQGPDSYTYNELRENINTTPVNISNRTTYNQARSNRNLIESLFFISRFAPEIAYRMAEDDMDLNSISNFLQTNMQILATESENKRIETANAKNKLPNYDMMKLYDKLALPFMALVFAVFALPLGMFSARSGRGEGLSISLVVVLVFYGFKSAIENAITQNRLSPEFVWLPALCFGVAALILFVQKVME